jgi:hypothetical protein
MPKTKAQARTHTPKPIPAMLEGSFGSAIENRIAEMNNQLAREGRLTNDPLAVSLRNIRVALREQGFTFDRVAPGTVATPTPTPAPKAAAPAAKTAPAKAPAAKTTKAPTKEAAAPATTKVKVRKIKPEQIEELQLAGSVSETAPYGTDAEGRLLAPYGVKNDGTPMKRRGRVAAPKAETAETAAPVASTPAVEETAEDAEVAAAEAALSEDDSEADVGEGTSVGDEDLDDLLKDL